MARLAVAVLLCGIYLPTLQCSRIKQRTSQSQIDLERKGSGLWSQPWEDELRIALNSEVGHATVHPFHGLNAHGFQKREEFESDESTESDHKAHQGAFVNILGKNLKLQHTYEGLEAPRGFDWGKAFWCEKRRMILVQWELDDVGNPGSNLGDLTHDHLDAMIKLGHIRVRFGHPDHIIWWGKVTSGAQHQWNTIKQKAEDEHKPHVKMFCEESHGNMFRRHDPVKMKLVIPLLDDDQWSYEYGTGDNTTYQASDKILMYPYGRLAVKYTCNTVQQHTIIQVEKISLILQPAPDTKLGDGPDQVEAFELADALEAYSDSDSESAYSD